MQKRLCFASEVPVQAQAAPVICSSDEDATCQWKGLFLRINCLYQESGHTQRGGRHQYTTIPLSGILPVI